METEILYYLWYFPGLAIVGYFCGCGLRSIMSILYVKE